MIARCDRCNAILPITPLSGPGRFCHIRDELGIIDALLCTRCTKDLHFFLADCPLVGDNTRSTAT